MFFDLKPGRLAWVVADEKGAITESVPGSLELLAPYTGLRSFIGQWSQEWGDWTPESRLLEREMPGTGGLLLEAVPIVSAAGGGTHPHPPHRVLICVSLPEERSARASSLRAKFDLTAAECRVATVAAEGCTPAEMALRLGLSVHTVRSHLKRIFVKVGVHSRSGLVRALLQRHDGNSRAIR